MNANRRCASNGWYLPIPLAARRKASNGAVENGYREERAVQSSVEIMIVNGERIDFLGEQTKEEAAAVRCGDTHHSNCLADRLFSISAGDDVLNRSGAYFGVCFAADKMQISVLNLQGSFCIFFDVWEADELDRLNES